MVTKFFDSVPQFSDHFTFSFIEELKKDVFNIPNNMISIV